MVIMGYVLQVSLLALFLLRPFPVWPSSESYAHPYECCVCTRHLLIYLFILDQQEYGLILAI
jgi:hypothetical protein